MDMFRNAEVVLMLCFGLLCAAAVAYRPAPSAAPQELDAANVPSMPIPVVVVRAKRLSAAEKAMPHQGAG